MFSALHQTVFCLLVTHLANKVGRRAVRHLAGLITVNRVGQMINGSLVVSGDL